jgi:hypothetical protein
MDTKDADDQYSREETARRRDEAIRRALNTPPKPQKDIAGKSGRKSKERPASKGRSQGKDADLEMAKRRGAIPQRR